MEIINLVPELEQVAAKLIRQKLNASGYNFSILQTDIMSGNVWQENCLLPVILFGASEFDDDLKNIICFELDESTNYFTDFKVYCFIAKKTKDIFLEKWQLALEKLINNLKLKAKAGPISLDFMYAQWFDKLDFINQNPGNRINSCGNFRTYSIGMAENIELSLLEKGELIKVLHESGKEGKSKAL